MKKIISFLLALVIILTSLLYYYRDYDLLNINKYIDYYMGREESLDKDPIEEPRDDLWPDEPQVNEDIRIIREMFYQALLEGEDEFSYKPKKLSRYECENLDIQSIIRENPDADLGYRGSSFEYTYIEPYIKEIKFKIDYFQDISQDGESFNRLTRAELLEKRRKVDRVVEDFLANYINSSMTDLEKEIAVHDYIVKKAEYNYEALSENIISVDNYNAYGILVEGLGVCDGYAKAFYLLGKAAGLEIKYVSGTARNELGLMPHAWNLIKLEDEWYNVDPTWNDPVFVNGDKPEDYLNYKYFNLSDEIIRDSHFRNPEYDKYPKARGKKYGRDALIEKEVIRNSY